MIKFVIHGPDLSNLVYTYDYQSFIKQDKLAFNKLLIRDIEGITFICLFFN
jgi:hypothetical protein